MGVSCHHTESEEQETAVADEEQVESIVLAIGRWLEEVDHFGSSHHSVVNTDIHNPAEDTVGAYVAVASHARWVAETNLEDHVEHSQPYGGRWSMERRLPLESESQREYSDARGQSTLGTFPLQGEYA